ncbi:hypothetical protein HA402_003539 [Bradysia odoriphaga]|nr:hypothetical protein HA402_003539 [Bradysia odoriphaga]
MEDPLELSGFSLDDAMIRYAYIGYDTVYEVRAWKEFKDFYKCEDNPTQLFDRFWDIIIPNIENYNLNSFIKKQLSWIYNPRKHPPPASQSHDNVEVISLIQFKRQQEEAMQQKMLNDPKLLKFQVYCLDYIKRSMPNTQPGSNQVSTNFESLVTVDRSEFDHRAGPSSRNSRFGGTSHLQIPRLTTSTPLPGANRLTVGQSNSRFGGTSHLEIPHPTTSSTPLPGANRLTVGQSNSRIGGTSHLEIPHPTTSSTPLPGANRLTLGQSNSRIGGTKQLPDWRNEPSRNSASNNQ